MQVDEITHRDEPPEVEDLIPEVKEIQRRRRRKLAFVVLAVVVAATVLSVYLAGAPPFARSSPTLPIVPLGGVAGSGSVHSASWPSLELDPIACPTAGTCVVGGGRPVGGQTQDVVLQQSGASWRVVALSKIAYPGSSGVRQLECASPGNCVAESDGKANDLNLYSERDGLWAHRQLSIRWSTSLDEHWAACSPGGFCWVGVLRFSPPGRGSELISTYAVGERNGQWLAPYPIGGTHFVVDGHLVTGVLGWSISCWSMTSCSVLGTAVFNGTRQAFVQTESNGSWGAASLLPRPSSGGPPSKFAIGEGFYTEGGVWSQLVCTSSDNCLIAGSEKSDRLGAVEQEINGRWQPPVTVGTSATFTSSAIVSLSCRSADLCVVAGQANPRAGHGPNVPFAQLEVDGHWLPPSYMASPRFSVASMGVTGVACPSNSTCYVIGNLTSSNIYKLMSGDRGTATSFVVRYKRSIWHWSLASVNGRWRGVGLNGVACVAQRCWVSGVILGGGVHATGIATQLR